MRGCGVKIADCDENFCVAEECGVDETGVDKGIDSGKDGKVHVV